MKDHTAAARAELFAAMREAIAYLKHQGHISPVTGQPHQGHEPAGGGGGSGSAGGAGGNGSGGEGRSDGGSATDKKVRDKEDEIRGQDYESAYAVGSDGTVLLDKDGGEHTVSFSRSEVSKMQDAIVTHNHPNGWSFTEEDISLAARADMAEIRIASRGADYSFTRPEGGWPSAARMSKIIASATSQTSDALWQQIRARTISADQADSEHFHLLWQNVAEQIGGTYTRTTR